MRERVQTFALPQRMAYAPLMRDRVTAGELGAGGAETEPTARGYPSIARRTRTKAVVFHAPIIGFIS